MCGGNSAGVSAATGPLPSWDLPETHGARGAPLSLSCAGSYTRADAASLPAVGDQEIKAAVRAGVSRSVASRALDIAEPDEKVLRLSEVQPEFKAPIWDYLGFLVNEQRVADGRAMMRQYDQILRAAERRFGVDRHVIAAVWGVETDYGREAGDNNLLILTTLFYYYFLHTKFSHNKSINKLKIIITKISKSTKYKNNKY